ncbi:MAG TPA: 4a-hydroxytetrahydrobiopterin dehydratase [Thermomicrobiales bacterium]|nr:4a-hydroxytetrahydrobiopterin dehydratase [Thermomicrobiales bacterium]
MSNPVRDAPLEPAQPLSNEEVDRELRSLTGWKREDGGLRKRFRRSGFLDAIAFVNAVAALSEEEQHHPNIDIRWRTVILFLTTHEAGGVSRRDLDLARRIDAIE